MSKERLNNLMKQITWERFMGIATFLGVVAMLFLNSQYVRISDFEKYQDRQTEIQTEFVRENAEQHSSILATLAKISITLAVQEKNASILQDHETRIRQLEKIVK